MEAIHMANDVMKNRPIKFRILELLYNGDQLWNYEIAKIITEEDNQTSKFQFNDINFDCIEVTASGFVESVEDAIDEDGSKLGAGRLRTKYKITDLGKTEYDWLASSIMHYGEKKEA